MPNPDAELVLLPRSLATHPKVLLVDDDAAVLDLLTQILEHNGFEVSSASAVNQRNIAMFCSSCAVGSSCASGYLGSFSREVNGCPFHK